MTPYDNPQIVLATYWRFARTVAGRGEMFVCAHCGMYAKDRTKLTGWCCPLGTQVAYENSLTFLLGHTTVHKFKVIRGS